MGLGMEPIDGVSDGGGGGEGRQAGVDEWTVAAVDMGEAATLALIAAVAGLMLRRGLARVARTSLAAAGGGAAAAASSETTPLLGAGANSVAAGESAAGSNASSNNAVARAFARSLAFLTIIAQLIATALSVTIAVIASTDPANGCRVATDATTAAAWIVATVVWSVSVAPASTDTMNRIDRDWVLVWIGRFWFLAVAFDFVQAYHWAIIMVDSTSPGSGTATTSILEAARAATFALRLVSSTSLLAVSYTSIPPRPVEPKQASPSSWKSSWSRFRKLVPFMWPRGLYLQCMVVLCFLLLIVTRVVNVLVPFQYKYVVDLLTDAGSVENKGQFYAWGAILSYCLLRYLSGGSGIILDIQGLLWIPVGQFNSREINISMLRHLHNLSLQFHINRKTGEVLRVMDRGTSSVSSLLSSIVFNIFPIFADIGVAVITFIVVFDLATGLIVLVTMMLFIVLTVVITEWRTKFRREMNTLDSLSRARAVDSLLNFETVKYYSNEEYEVSRFEQSINDYQVADWKSSASLSLLNTAQKTIVTLSLLAGSLLVGSRVVRGELTVGDFVMFMTYILNVYFPLSWFGTYYRQIQQNFVDMEAMFDLLAQDVDIKDAPDAKALSLNGGGSVTFENVTFTYSSANGKPAIRNLSFHVPARTTTALVGLTGSGKSTVFRLLFRFYNPDSGRILVDGQDIAKVTQQSLRKAIGCVPQDTVLFNQSVLYNIAYGDVTASEEEVHEAARKAQIHDRIMEFPEKYQTRVGERGLRLSGGEKQRVAIARTILKKPEIILLDEATSALDNTTELMIQRSLKDLTSRCTTLVIAHRLSTVVDADNIIVMKDGRVIESGTHEALLAAGERASPPSEDGVGAYYIMWHRQKEEVADSLVVDPSGGSASLSSVTPGSVEGSSGGEKKKGPAAIDMGFYGLAKEKGRRH